MTEIVEFLRDFNIYTILIRLLLAAVFGAVIGLERGRQRRAAGLRTHILVCIGSALTAMVGYFSVGVLGHAVADPLRVSAQVISGIGFLGAGTIMLKGRFQITGLTTAAGLWVTAAMGVSLGAGFYEGAIVTFIVSVITVALLSKLEYKINSRHSSFGLYIEIKGDVYVRECIDYICEAFDAGNIQVTVPRSGIAGNVGIESILSPSKKKRFKIKEVTSQIEKIEYVVYAIEAV